MVFSSALFLFIFLPVLLSVYYLADKKYKNILLLIAGVIFYAWGAPKFIFVVLATTLLDFFLANLIYKHKSTKKSKTYLVISIIINLGLLFYFKYFGFFAANLNALFGGSFTTVTEIALPLGISFYIFETITYVVDVYRGVHKPLSNFWDYQLYIILFPKLISGPIVRYHEIADQITNRDANETIDNKLAGFYRFCMGLAKKVLIADVMATVVIQIYGNPNDATYIPKFGPEQVSMGTAWLGALAYTFQIYFDFSGYSDMALGLGRMFGFKFPENFNNPYTSQSITEFWRRWHITLGNWMKNYLYIPLGGNRSSSKIRVYFNLWIVFLLSGLWHGANWNFLLWGAFHGTFLVMDRVFLERLTKFIGKPFRILLTFFIVVIGWVIFRVENLHNAFGFIKAMFGMGQGKDSLVPDHEFIMCFGFAVLFAFFCVFRFTERFSNRIYAFDFKLSGHFVFTVLSLVFLLFSISYITSSDFHPFIYYRF